ncbi:MAG: hypothetical protein RMI89_04195 [Gloeomargarita sp. SKYBB_i_bin120]|nr:hypothetical protein [Gloeomargarita sp. SKYG98]MCS7292159.1 hypothetical protein [Gloeomargarita sp. SKYB120]MDW8177720.1 hypothetical protein [Gloeomargarita sp. SKYBB_i_bin120]
MPFTLIASDQPASLAFTDKGLQFEAAVAQFGSQRGWTARQIAVANVPTPASLTFTEMPQTSYLSLLRIGYRFVPPETANPEEGTVEFRRVNLE